jgi:heme exporter protein D
MIWKSWSDFWTMGGYALYVWGSYAVTLGLIATEVVMLALRKRNILNELRAVALQKETRSHETPA